MINQKWNENKDLKNNIKRQLKKASFFLMDEEIYQIYDETKRTFMTLDFFLNSQYKNELENILERCIYLNELQYKF
tara:strand:+ start:359 stop:586 length:228 start_codon:yes stop_codon:yes gene_type:complete